MIRVVTKTPPGSVSDVEIGELLDSIERTLRLCFASATTPDTRRHYARRLYALRRASAPWRREADAEFDLRLAEYV